MRIRDAIGTNLRHIRLENDLRQEDLTRAVRRFGGKWTYRELAQIERGNKAVSLETLVVLLLALREVTGTTYGPEDLLAGHPVEVNDTVTIDDLGDLRDLHGSLNRSAQPRELRSPAISLFARRHGIDPDLAVKASLELWGRSFDEERDAYIDDTDDPTPGAIKNRRGRVSRQLYVELLHHLKGTES